jgi:hypothetical protein
MPADNEPATPTLYLKYKAKLQSIPPIIETL